MLESIEGHVALVTGAARGIGLESARALGGMGAKVVVWDKDAAAVAQAAAKLAQGNIVVTAAVVDVTDESQVNDGMRHIVSEHGSVDILVNNAGIYPHRSIEETTPELWQSVMAVNLDSAFLCTKAAFHYMKQKRYGRVVNLASAVAYEGLNGVSAYAAAKAGVIGFTRVAATEGGPFGITVNAVAPGLIETEGVMADIADLFDQVIETQVIKRRGRPGDIASAIAYFASPQAGFVTGQTLSVNGGCHYQ